VKTVADQLVSIDRWEGRVAFITGGAQGIGLGIARALAKRGVKLAIADVNDDKLLSARSDLGTQTDVSTFALDVRDRVAFAAAADEAESQLGPVSLLFNNAGVAGSTSPGRMSYESWDWVIDINLHGVINGLQTFVPRMIGRKQDGYVVNTSSGAGLAGGGSGYLYTTSKFAVVGMSEALHLELAHHSIGVSVLCPGPVATDIVSNTAALRPSGDPPSSRVRETMSKAAEMLARGVSPDAVGEMVTDAMAAGRLYIHTDDSMVPYVKARSEAILAAMPSELNGARGSGRVP
jgi:NAD(P)-dependent dehydrogenase (short-subunit alcohol dehydrogenase family)